MNDNWKAIYLMIPLLEFLSGKKYEIVIEKSLTSENGVLKEKERFYRVMNHRTHCFEYLESEDDLFIYLAEELTHELETSIDAREGEWI